MKTGILTFVLTMLIMTLAGRAWSEPLHIIIVTEHKNRSEKLYGQFLQEIYRGNAIVSIEPDRYDEDLSEAKKQELEAADLIIVSRDTESTQYNNDAEFWNQIQVPILNHNAKLVRSDTHRFWDWLPGDTTTCDPCSSLIAVDKDDPIFEGIATSTGIEMFTSDIEIDLSDQVSAGNGTVVATAGGNVLLARWTGTEPYYDGSLYAPGAPRIFFAMPNPPSDFFDHATDEALRMLTNATLSLRKPIALDGDLDDDGDVDLVDFSILAACWTNGEFPSAPLCGDADPSGNDTVDAQDLRMLADTWLTGVDITPPEPEVMTWSQKPKTVSTRSITMQADTALDSQNGVRYDFQCVSGQGPDSFGQYRSTFEPDALTPGRLYTYRVRARDTSANLNENQWSSSASARTFGLHRYMADASGAVALNDKLVIVAGDELNFLRIYEWAKPESAPIQSIDLTSGLNIDPDHPESDIEGATWLGDRIFWITSHGRNTDGQYRYSRCQFFATSVTFDGNVVHVTVDGNYANLLDDLIAYDSVYNLGLADAIGVVDGHVDPSTIPHLAPKIDGLNIEGLCADSDGDSLLIAFRNPRPDIDGDIHALIIPLMNPVQVVLSGATPQFGPPILLDLGILGIRSIEYSSNLDRYLVIAGSHLSSSDSPLEILYSYDGIWDDRDKLAEFTDLTPEALFQFPSSNDIHLLSDDGILIFQTPQGPVENKYLPVEQRTFRTHTITP
ncbi:MAG: hypothetical protein GX455_17335 [Phycisphaerae bacterium]|nr:hypothetical protein [Phycisphaerae bacterium]